MIRFEMHLVFPKTWKALHMIVNGNERLSSWRPEQQPNDKDYWNNNKKKK
jgi:hypothetical protein